MGLEGSFNPANKPMHLPRELANESDVYRYEVDRDNRITGVGRNWGTFAEENNWAGERCLPEKVVGQDLIDFIASAEARQLYRVLMDRARQGFRVGPIPFRCDAPEERRFLELRMEPRAHGHVAIESRIIRREPREKVALLEASTPRTEKFLRICSMCKKVDLDKDHWVEIEEAMTQLRLFEQDALPLLTHGLCQTCHQATRQRWEDRA